MIPTFVNEKSMYQFNIDDYADETNDELYWAMYEHMPHDLGDMIVDDGNRLDWNSVGLDDFICDSEIHNDVQFATTVRAYIMEQLQELFVVHEYAAKDNYEAKVDANIQFMMPLYRLLK